MTAPNPMARDGRQAGGDLVAAMVAAADAERDATAEQPAVVVGPARYLAAGSTALRWFAAADTGRWRLGDVALEHLELVTPTARLAPRRVHYWQDDHLELEFVGPRPDSAADAADAAATAPDGATGWSVEVRAGRHPFAAARAERLGDMVDPGVSAVLLATDVDATAADALQLFAGDGPARLEALATATAALEHNGRRVLLVAPDHREADALLLAVRAALGAVAVGAVIRLGTVGDRRLADDVACTIEAALDLFAAELTEELAEIAAQARHLGEPVLGAFSDAAPSDQALANAQANLAEAATLRAAAEARTRDAAATHSAALAAVEAIEASRERFALADRLIGDIQQASGQSAASAAGVGKLAEALRNANPAEADHLVRQLLVALDVATRRLDARDVALADLAGVRRELAQLGVDRAALARAETARQAARDAHTDAEAALRVAVDAEEQAAADLKAIVDARLRRAVDDQGGADRAARWEALRRRHAAALDARDAQRAAVLETARVVVCTVEDVALRPELAGQRFDHVLVQSASALPLATLVLVASHAVRAVALALDPAERPPAPQCGDADRTPWLATSIVDRLGLRAERGALRRHPRVLQLDQP